jgi:hypothetical protein
MADLSTFKQYYKLADILIEKAMKEQLAECADCLRSISAAREDRIAEAAHLPAISL